MLALRSWHSSSSSSGKRTMEAAMKRHIVTHWVCLISHQIWPIMIGPNSLWKEDQRLAQKYFGQITLKWSQCSPVWIGEGMTDDRRPRFAPHVTMLFELFCDILHSQRPRPKSVYLTLTAFVKSESCLWIPTQGKKKESESSTNAAVAFKAPAFWNK